MNDGQVVFDAACVETMESLAEVARPRVNGVGVEGAHDALVLVVGAETGENCLHTNFSFDFYFEF